MFQMYVAVKWTKGPESHHTSNVCFILNEDLRRESFKKVKNSFQEWTSTYGYNDKGKS